jgi:FtsP/CotA-like multicopper oxidase with cupredoxin domain
MAFIGASSHKTACSANYLASEDRPILLAPGNRADLLVKAPSGPLAAPYQVMVEESVTRSGGGTAPLMSVEITGEAPTVLNQTKFIDAAPTLPDFLSDITNEEVISSPTRTLVFDSKGQGAPFQHTLNGDQFNDRTIGVTAFLNTAEEWKVMNTTVQGPVGPGLIDHPFHIHINPFQVVEVFDPNEKIPNPENPGQTVPKYVFEASDLKFPGVQCRLDLNDPGTWKDCHNVMRENRVWWDVFPIPSGRFPTDASGNPIQAAGGDPLVIPGYFRMRSRFVDYPGLYVLHCHILAHEDRGMMTIVQVAPVASGWSPGVYRHH